jgi:hypothetical protein
VSACQRSMPKMQAVSTVCRSQSRQDSSPTPASTKKSDRVPARSSCCSFPSACSVLAENQGPAAPRRVVRDPGEAARRIVRDPHTSAGPRAGCDLAALRRRRGRRALGDGSTSAVAMPKTEAPELDLPPLAMNGLVGGGGANLALWQPLLVSAGRLSLHART